MSKTRIHRYLFREIISPTVLSLLIFTLALLIGRIPMITKLLTRQGASLSAIGQLFVYLIPAFLSITLPLSFLLGILLAFGRLSADSEFVALKASGVSLYGLLKPVVWVALVVSLMTGWMTITVAPASQSTFRQKLFDIASQNLSVNIKPGTFTDQLPGLIFYAAAVDEKHGHLNDVFIVDQRNSKAAATIAAETGRLLPDKDRARLVLRLGNGTIHRISEENGQSRYQTVGFTNYDLNIDLATPASSDKRYQKKSEMSWQTLNQAIDSSQNPTVRRRLLVEKHERLVITFAPLALLLVGVPLGLQSHRSGKGAGFTLALVIFIIYYVLLSLAGTLAEQGTLPAALIIWLPNICFLIGGSWFLHRTTIEKPLAVFSWPQRLAKRRIRRKAARGGDK